jgi:hypothetical protein
LHYGVDINPVDQGVAIGSGGSFFQKLEINTVSKVITFTENYSLVI